MQLRPDQANVVAHGFVAELALPRFSPHLTVYLPVFGGVEPEPWNTPRIRWDNDIIVSGGETENHTENILRSLKIVADIAVAKHKSYSAAFLQIYAEKSFQMSC